MDKINKTPLGWFVLSSVCTIGRGYERVLHSVFSVTMTALFWTELRCSCWNHSPSLGVIASNAPNYHRDHFWLSPPTSAPFISSTPGISFPFLPSSWCYCQCGWANLSRALICSLSATTMSAPFAKSNLSVWNVKSHQTSSLLFSTTLRSTFHQDIGTSFYPWHQCSCTFSLGSPS